MDGRSHFAGGVALRVAVTSPGFLGPLLATMNFDTRRVLGDIEASLHSFFSTLAKLPNPTFDSSRTDFGHRFPKNGHRDIAWPAP